jgi:hypothetical protein
MAKMTPNDFMPVNLNPSVASLRERKKNRCGVQINTKNTIQKLLKKQKLNN